jgi:YfiH family protein
MDLLRPHWPDAPASVRALATTRDGGASTGPYAGLNLGTHVGDAAARVAANRARLAALLPSAPVWLTQVHGCAVVDAAQGGAPEADAAIASQAGVVCAVLTADCLPVLLCDRAGGVVGAAHAGWRGLANGVIERTVEAMRARGGADITAWLGPAIGPFSFEVGEDVLAAFAHLPGASADFAPRGNGKYLADIYALARKALAGCGVDSVAGGEWDTVRDPRFYSYRRDGVTGRMASLIWLTPE